MKACAAFACGLCEEGGLGRSDNIWKRGVQALVRHVNFARTDFREEMAMNAP